MHGIRRGFKRIGQMVTKIKKIGIRSCATLVMVTENQARELKDAGLTAYYHKTDTSREHYPMLIFTRSYYD